MANFVFLIMAIAIYIDSISAACLPNSEKQKINQLPVRGSVVSSSDGSKPNKLINTKIIILRKIKPVHEPVLCSENEEEVRGVSRLQQPALESENEPLPSGTVETPSEPETQVLDLRNYGNSKSNQQPIPDPVPSSSHSRKLNPLYDAMPIPVRRARPLVRLQIHPESLPDPSLEQPTLASEQEPLSGCGSVEIPQEPEKPDPCRKACN